MKVFFAALILAFTAPAVFAADVALVYENEAAVREGKFVMASIAPEGAMITAKMALANNSTLLVGFPNDKLKKAVLLRLDSKLDVALIQAGEVVSDEALQKEFQEKASGLSAFLPGGSVAVSPGVQAVVQSTEAFIVKINGVPVSDTPVELIVKDERSEMGLEVVRPAASPLWKAELKMTAEPKLSFWKKNKERKTLSDIPRPVFTYSHQSMFRPFSEGRSFYVPVEIHFVKETNYTLVVTIESKAGPFEKRIPVVFKQK